MIEPFVESIVSLADAARLCPRRRGGKRPHISCLYRWTVDGCRGVVLECVQIGGTRCTSHEALARFFERLTSQSRGEVPMRAASQKRQRELADAERELEEEGA